MKVGIIGKGMIVHDLFNFIHDVDGVELIGISATPKSKEALVEIAKEQNIPNVYTSTEEMLQNPDIDTIYVAVPNHLHYEFGKKALEAGKNVIMEKPFTSNYDEAKELADLAHEKGLMVLEAVSTRYIPNVKAIKENLPKLGQLKIVSMNYSQYSSRYNAFKEGIVQPAFDPSKSGGALMDLNIYNINLAVYLFGEPKSVDYLPNIQKGIDTSGILVMDYEDFKCVCIAAKDCKAPLLSTIQGDEGCILMHSPANAASDFTILMNSSMAKSGAGAEEESQDLNGGKHRMYHEFVEFERILREKDENAAEEALQASLATMKIQTEARKKGGVVFAADQK